jgi:hypothetical protein
MKTSYFSCLTDDTGTPAPQTGTGSEWANLKLPLHLSSLRRLLTSNFGIVLISLLNLVGILSGILTVYESTVSNDTSLYDGHDNKGLKFLACFWLCLNFLLCPIAIYCSRRILVSKQVQRLLINVVGTSPNFVTGIEFLAHQNLSILLIAMLLYVVFIGKDFAISFALCTCLPLYIAVTTSMLILESLRQQSQNFVFQLTYAYPGFGSLEELKEGYMKVWKHYNATYNRDCNFLIFLIVYIFTFLIVCMWWAYTIETAVAGLLGFIFVLFMYFLQVFLFVARANEMGLSMAIAAAQYILLQHKEIDESAGGFASCGELNLFISCVNLVRPEVSLHGFVLRYRGSFIVIGAMVTAIIPRLFLAGVLSTREE